jgi:hypothetical protein
MKEQKEKESLSKITEALNDKTIKKTYTIFNPYL